MLHIIIAERPWIASGNELVMANDVMAEIVPQGRVFWQLVTGLCQTLTNCYACTVLAPIHVAFVCAANTCRSAMADQVFRQVFAQRGLSDRVSFSSAGVFASNGSPMTRWGRESLAEHGLDGTAHKSSAVSRDLVVDSDVIIAMTEGLRTELLLDYPAAADKTVTMPDFRQVGGGKLFVAALPGFSFGSAGDIGDPWGMAARDYDDLAGFFIEQANAFADWVEAQ